MAGSQEGFRSVTLVDLYYIKKVHSFKLRHAVPLLVAALCYKSGYRGSFPDDVTAFFRWPNPSIRIGVGSSSKRNEYQESSCREKQAADAYGWQLHRHLWASTSHHCPSPPRNLTGITLPLLCTYSAEIFVWFLWYTCWWTFEVGIDSVMSGYERYNAINLKACRS
jgi:hypothetical protein